MSLHLSNNEVFYCVLTLICLLYFKMEKQVNLKIELCKANKVHPIALHTTQCTEVI